MQIKHKILFFPEKEQGKPDGKIRMRVRWNNNIAQFNVGYRVNINKWVSDSQRCKNNTTHGKNSIPASTINRAIQHYEDMAEEVFYHFEQSKTIPTTQEYKDKFNTAIGKLTKTTKQNIFDDYNEFIISESKENSWTIATTLKHRTIRTHLYNFSPQLQYKDLTEKGLNQFIDYMLSLDAGEDSTMRNTTIKKDLNILKWFLRWATRKGYNHELAYITYKPKLKTIPRKIIYLEWNELMQVYNTPIPPHKQYLQRVRDKFLFCCFTSLRYSDMEALRWSNVHTEHIEIVTVKTNDPIRIELNDYSKEILSRYPRKGEHVFPPITNQKMNEYLKELCKLSGIDTPITQTYYCGNQRIERTQPKHELITTHTGRRTFICNALMLGIAPNIVMKWTGHSDYNAMKPYIEIADSAKKSAMSLFNK